MYQFFVAIVQPYPLLFVVMTVALVMVWRKKKAGDGERGTGGGNTVGSGQWAVGSGKKTGGGGREKVSGVRCQGEGGRGRGKAGQISNLPSSRQVENLSHVAEGQEFQRNNWPVGPRVRLGDLLIYQGVALRWMKGWAFGPNTADCAG